MSRVDLGSGLLARLRCPDCLRACVEGTPEGFLCGGCGRELPLSGGVLYALPRKLALAQAANRAYYDEISAEEANVLARRAKTRNHRAKMRLVLDALELGEGVAPCTVLEGGVGHGTHGAALRARGHAFAGVDIAPELLHRARARYPVLRDATLVAADSTRLPFQDGLFDAAFCVAMLHHLPLPEEGVAELLRVLRPHGRFCFLEPRRLYPTTVWQYLRHPKTEVSVLKMTVRNVTRWAREAGAREVSVAFGVFTPNGPAVLTRVWDAVDRLCAAATPLRLASIMFCVHGRK